MPSIAITRQYEAIYIIRPDATEEQVETTVNKYRQVVLNTGGTLGKVDRWERRKLAYEIAGYNEGLYVIMEFSAEAKTEVELRRQFQISEDQIRYMIVKREDTDATGAAAAPTAPAAEKAAPAPPVVVEPVVTAVETPAVQAVVETAEAAPSEETQAPEAEETAVEAVAA